MAEPGTGRTGARLPQGRDLLVGVDAGTSVIKSVAFDLSGRQIAAAALPNSYERIGAAGVEQDQLRTWADTARTLKLLGEKVENLAQRVVAVAVTGQGDGTWLIDAGGEPVGGGWLWLDARAGGIVDRLRADPADAERYRLTGAGLAACQQGPQLLWMRANQPERIARAATVFHCKDWLYYKLTGTRATDPSEAVFSFGDFRTRTFAKGVSEALGLVPERRLLPPVVDGATTHHPLSAEAAALTGLAAGTPVVLGYVDVVCTALGAGLYDPDVDCGCSIVGSTGMHLRLAEGAENIRLNPERTGYVMLFPVPGVLSQVQSNMSATLNVDWLLDLAGGLLRSLGLERPRSELLAQVETWLAEAGAHPPLYHPYISEAGERGPFVDTSARASLIGLDSATGFGDIARAVFEGLALAARDCYLAMGALPARVRLSGGAARSPTLRRIIGAALGAETQTSTREEAGAAGAAMIAAVSLGLYPAMGACARDWALPLLRPVEPADPALARHFEALYPAYRATREALRPLWGQLPVQKDQTP